MRSTATKIRRLAAADVDQLNAMLSLFGEAFNEHATYGSARPSRRYSQTLLSNEMFVALTAFQGDQVVGALVAYELPKFEQERSEFYIYDLAVAPSRRRQGVATSMIETLKQIATVRGGHVVFVQADYGDEPAIALYTKLGTREDVMHFDIPLP